MRAIQVALVVLVLELVALSWVVGADLLAWLSPAWTGS